MNSIEIETIKFKLFETMCDVHALSDYIDGLDTDEETKDRHKRIVLESCAFALCNEEERHEILNR